MTVLADMVVDTDYGQFDLGWGDGDGFDGDDDRAFAGQVNGWVGAADPDGIYIVLARRSGGSHVVIALHDTDPAPADTKWEDVVEVSALIPPGGAGWGSWGGESGGELDVPPGSYRVRVSARGRDAGAADEFAEGVVDHYLIEFWPAAMMPDTIVRTGSTDAQYWHDSWGNRR